MLLFIENKWKLIGFVVLFAIVKDHFPPHIYYKIFTHRPVQDVGAFSPRDYTSVNFKRRVPRDMHNKITRQKHVQGDSFWGLQLYVGLLLEKWRCTELKRVQLGDR